MITNKPSESYLSHLYWLLSGTIALTTAFLLTNLGRMMTISMVGHLGTEELAGMSVAQMLDDCSFFCILIGVTTTLDTLCGQSWTGSKDKTTIGLHLQRGICIYGVLFFPIAIFWSVCLIMLQGTGFMGPNELHYASVYLCFMIPSCLAFGIYYMLGAYLRAQGIMRIATYSALIVFPMTVITNYAFISGNPFSWGIAGAGLAGAVTSITVCGFNIGYIYWIAGSEGWGGWTRDCLHEWLPAVKLLIPSTFLVLVEIVVPRLCSLAASRFGSAALGAHFILLNTNATCISFALSLKQIMLTRISNLMGKGALADTKRSIIVGNSLALITGLASAIPLLACRFVYPSLFTKDETMAHIVSESLPLLALIQVLGTFHYNQVGIAYGLGRQRQTSYIIFVSYVLISLPCCYFFAFPMGWSVYGLWIGNAIAEFFAGVFLFLYLNTLDLQEEAQRIMNQIFKEK
ncbi:mate-domain-containing protein [Phascolomyces articulosus]|uniref:Mate-domain-containing protein n=1 Tax=Phascolomyces articulosus TaxID=60185 RepID=A0AAD5JMG5_9FUNG|nr:mate-domain-containing protein [Phascolomyces articulosus]